MEHHEIISDTLWENTQLHLIDHEKNTVKQVTVH